MNGFLQGATMMGSAAVGLFFLRFWRKTGDRLFAAFALAFGLMAARRVLQSLFRVASEHVHYFYVIQMLAYTIIIYAIIDKNRAMRR
jgi:hypothetical protein